MDPLSLAVAALLAKAAEGFGADLGATAAAALRGLTERLRRAFAGNRAADQSLSELETSPQDAAAVDTAAQHIEAALGRDPGLRNEVDGLVADLKTDPAVARFIVTVSGNATVGKITNIGNVTGNVSF